jgi:phosphoribosylglycinamide formyltransferase-1
MRLAWAVSGQGMIARAVFEAGRAGLIASRIDLVVFDRVGPTSAMIDYCRANGIACSVVEPEDIEGAMIGLQASYRLDWMGLTFNRILPEAVIAAFRGNIFNLHFSLLPAFPGFGATRKALQSNVQHTGVTVHLIDAGVDTGPILAQKRVDVLRGDTVETLGRRQFEAAVPLAVQTVRRAEKGMLLPFVQTDEDIEEFCRGFCAGLKQDSSRPPA